LLFSFKSVLSSIIHIHVGIPGYYNTAKPHIELDHLEDNMLHFNVIQKDHFCCWLSWSTSANAVWNTCIKSLH